MLAMNEVLLENLHATFHGVQQTQIKGEESKGSFYWIKSKTPREFSEKMRREQLSVKMYVTSRA